MTATDSRTLLETLVTELTSAGWRREKERRPCPVAIDRPSLLLASPDGATHLHAAVSTYGHLESILCGLDPEGAQTWRVGTGALAPSAVIEAARAAREQPNSNLEATLRQADWVGPGVEHEKFRITKAWFSPDGTRELILFYRPWEPDHYYDGHLKRPDRSRADARLEFDAVPDAVTATLALAS